MSRTMVTLTREMQEDYGYNEAIKTLRTNILFCGSQVRVIMFTSAVPGEGKSDITLAAAQSMAQLGKKVLVIDGDIRRSMLVTRYQLKEKVNGLSQYLCGQKKLEEVIYNTSVENLSMIFAGPYSPNPAELLEERLFTSLLEYARGEFDYIMIDTPPMASLIDGAIVARQCDGAVMVIESGAISYKAEQRVKAQLEKSGCRILGAVLNKVDVTAQGYYGTYGKYGKYKKYDAYASYDQKNRDQGYQIGERSHRSRRQKAGEKEITGEKEPANEREKENGAFKENEAANV